MNQKRIFIVRRDPRSSWKMTWCYYDKKRREPKGVDGKYESLLKGPFEISKVFGANFFKLSYLDGTEIPLSYNDQDLKLYQL